MTGFDTPLTEMKLSEFQRICQSIGIDIEKHHLLVLEMFWDGFCAREVQEQIEVLEDKEKYAHIRSL